MQLVEGLASFSGPNEVTVNGEKHTADHILIAVGGKPQLPEMPGIEHCISSDGFFGLEHQPARVAVIGGGYIGVELAGVFHGLGTKTDLFVRADKPLKDFDTIITDTLVKEMKKQGLTLHTKQSPVSVTKSDDGSLTMQMASGDIFGPFDQIVFATGRVPLLG